MTTLSISAVMNAMAAVAEAQADESDARANYDGHSWDYHGSRYIDSVDSAKEAAEAVLREYIAQEVAEQVKAALQGQQAAKRRIEMSEERPGGPVERIVGRHTPGPWRFVPWHVEESPSAVRAPAGWIICTTSSDCDARVIAAAPELLAALELARDYVTSELAHLREAFKGYEKVGGIASAERDLATVDAAIAKALGMKANAALSGQRPAGSD